MEGRCNSLWPAGCWVQVCTASATPWRLTGAAWPDRHSMACPTCSEALTPGTHRWIAALRCWKRVGECALLPLLRIGAACTWNGDSWRCGG